MSSRVRDDDATTTQREPAGVSMPVVVGLVAAPGLAEDLAGALVRELPALLHECFRHAAWLFVVRPDARAGPTGMDVDVVRLARERMLAEGWDLSVCLTERPQRVGCHPATAYASVALGVGVVSVPALGVVGVEDRVRESVLRLLERLRPAVRGNLRLLAGVVRANRPWELIPRLTRARAAALGGAALSIVSPGVWKIGAAAGSPRMLVLAAGSVLVASASLVVAHGLWEQSPGPGARDRVVLPNLAVVLTAVLGVLTLYLALLMISAAFVGLLVPGVVGAGDDLRLAWLVSSLATIAGGLGVLVESDAAVREAVYGYRSGD